MKKKTEIKLETFEDRIQRLMDDADMDLLDVARAVGCYPQTIRAWMNGVAPNCIWVSALCRALGTDPNGLLSNVSFEK